MLSSWSARFCRPLVWLGALASMALWLPATAHAQVKRLETFANYFGSIIHRGSNDGGSSWSAWVEVPGYVDRDNNKWFVGTPAAVSDQPGRLHLVARTTNGLLMINTYTSGAGIWRGWEVVPGVTPAGGGTSWFEGGVWIKEDWFRDAGYSWVRDSYPAISSWGPGRLDLFMHAIKGADNTITLVHTWANNANWADNGWEVLGTGWMQGSPGVVSNGVGRIDVFVRGGGNELVRKSFADGRWSDWLSIGGFITSSPTVASSGHPSLHVFARGGSGQLWQYFTYGYLWPSWTDLGGFLAEGTSPAATSIASGALDVFVTGSDGVSLQQKSYNPSTSSWSGLMFRGQASAHIATVAWVP